MTEMTTTVGCDVEFEAWRQGHLLHADRDCHATRHVGQDGSGCQVEIRPAPTSSPAVLYRRVISLARAYERREEITLTVSGHEYPLGCHLHVACPGRRIASDEAAEIVRLVDCRPTALGELGQVLLDLSGAARGDYRRRAAYRVGKAHGGIEYRTPPSLLLASRAAFTYCAEVLRAAALRVCAKQSAEVPEFPHAEFERLLELRRSGRPVGIDGDPVGGIRWHLEPGIWSYAWREEVCVWNAEIDSHIVHHVRLIPLREARGLVTTSRRIAARYGWEPISWASRGIGVPYAIRCDDATWTRKDVREFLELAASCVFDCNDVAEVEEEEEE